MAAHPPGWPTRGTSRLLAFLRDRGLPFLRSADDATLRADALGMRTATRRLIAGPLRSDEAADHDRSDAHFVELGEDDSVTLLPDNREAFLAKCAAVESAERSIDCALYYLADDKTGAHFADLLALAASRGVRVRLGADAYASVEKQYGPFGYGPNPARGSLVLLDKLRTAGCETYLLGTDHWCMHRKFLFIDRKELVIGGRNIADHYAEPGWRDLELLFGGRFAESFVPVVEGTFASMTKPVAPVRGILAGVPGRAGSVFARAASALVGRATATVDIEHAYFLSHPWLLDVLRAAMSRGVRVRVFTNSGSSNDLPFMNWRLATSIRELVEIGVHVFRRRAGSPTLHTKLIVADGRRVIFGSTNLDYYSPLYCAELDIAIESERLGAALTKSFEDGLEASSTEAVVPGTAAESELQRECSPWSVSRLCDLVLHDIQ